MLFAKKPKDIKASSSAGTSEELQSITQNLYKQNLELAVKNKTLSLLGKLYEISIQTLSPVELSQKLTSVIQADFEFERVAIFKYDEKIDTAIALADAESARFHEARKEMNVFFDDVKYPNVSQLPCFKEIFETKRLNFTQDIATMWSYGLNPEQLEKLKSEGHAKSIALLPLLMGGKVIGFFGVTMNRPYEELVEYEKESLQNFANVIAVALDKAQLYQELTVTNEKLADANERLKQLDQLKSEFLSVASHQLRAPITAIKGYLANVAEGLYGAVPEYLNEPLGVVQESARVMTSSIEDYLNVSRIEQGRMKYDFTEFDITPLAKRATEELEPVAQKKNLTLIFNDSPEAKINADFGKIKQVFTNLIDNAIKYTEQGSVTVSVSTEGDHVRFMTQDTGIGIPADEIGKLFDKFMRARDANKVNTTGTGLGLYVAKNLVEGHGGKIWAESDGPGKGSRFIVELPVHPSEPPEFKGENGPQGD
jgi:signal transduction histidine kinase